MITAYRCKNCGAKRPLSAKDVACWNCKSFAVVSVSQSKDMPPSRMQSLFDTRARLLRRIETSASQGRIREAILKLGHLRDKRDIDTLIGWTNDDCSESYLPAVLTALGNFEEHRVFEALAPFVEESPQTKDPSVVSAACEALVNVGGAQAREPLVAGFNACMEEPDRQPENWKTIVVSVASLDDRLAGRLSALGSIMRALTSDEDVPGHQLLENCEFNQYDDEHICMLCEAFIRTSNHKARFLASQVLIGHGGVLVARTLLQQMADMYATRLRSRKRYTEILHNGVQMPEELQNVIEQTFDESRDPYATTLARVRDVLMSIGTPALPCVLEFSDHDSSQIRDLVSEMEKTFSLPRYEPLIQLEAQKPGSEQSHESNNYRGQCDHDGVLVDEVFPLNSLVRRLHELWRETMIFFWLPEKKHALSCDECSVWTDTPMQEVEGGFLCNKCGRRIALKDFESEARGDSTRYVHAEVVSIGLDIQAAGGNPYMEEALRRFESVGGYKSTLSHAWAGVGDWQS